MEKTKTVQGSPFVKDEIFGQLRGIAERLAYLISGFVLAQSKIFSLSVPFAVSLAAAAEGNRVFLTVAGAALGAVLGLDGTSLVRVLALLLGAAAVKTVIKKAGHEDEERRIMPPTVLAMSLISGAAVILATGFTADKLIVFVADSVLCAAATAILERTVSGLKHSSAAYLPDRQLMTCCMISAGIVLLSLAPFEIYGIHPARIAAAFAVVLLAFLSAETGGSVAGICAGVAIAASGTSGGLAICYPLLGLISGILSQKGQLASAVGACVTAGAFALLDGTADGAAVLAETATAAVVFVCLPHRRLERLRTKLIAPEIAHLQQGYLGTPRMLHTVASALGEVSQCVKSVSQGIASLAPNEDELIAARVCERVCGDCPLRGEASCPEKGEFSFIIRFMRENGSIAVENLPESFAASCPCASRLCASFNRVFKSSCTVSSLNAQTDRCRELACGQLSTVSRLLSEVSVKIGDGERILYEKERTARRVMEENGLKIITLSCTEPVSGAVTLQASVEAPPHKFSLSRLQKELEGALSVEFTPGEMTRDNESASLHFERKALFRIRLGSAGEAAGGERLCGDYFDSFTDGAQAFILLSDGMGTGGRAAIDAAMTVEVFSKLIKAGLSADTALDITNTALTVKSHDESISTLDVAQINLFTGEGVLYKAGGAASFYTSEGRVHKAELRSLPLGILSKAEFATHSFRLHDGDLLLLMSDGVCPGQPQWLRDEIKMTESFGNAGDFAEHILKAASAHNSGRRDDMTVVAAVAQELRD